MDDIIQTLIWGHNLGPSFRIFVLYCDSRERRLLLSVERIIFQKFDFILYMEANDILFLINSGQIHTLAAFQILFFFDKCWKYSLKLWHGLCFECHKILNAKLVSLLYTRTTIYFITLNTRSSTILAFWRSLVSIRDYGTLRRLYLKSLGRWSFISSAVLLSLGCSGIY